MTPYYRKLNQLVFLVLLFWCIMASSSNKNIETCTIIPNDQVHNCTMPLTFLDTIWIQSDPVSRVFFYEFPKPTTDFWNTLLPQLKKSLSLTLQHYVPVAGHLTWPQDSKSPVVQYSTGDGVSLTVAESPSDFHSLSAYEFRGTTELVTLLPQFTTSETQAPALTLQITLFPNAGFSIGCVAHHAVMDGKSLSMFMHSWAYICKNVDGSILPPELTPSFDRSFVDQQAELEKIYPKNLGGNPTDMENKSLILADETYPPDVMLGTFTLSRKNISAMKKSLSNSFPRLSTFTVISAYAFLCLIKAKKIASGFACISVNADARGRLEPPIPSTYFGNCVVGSGGGGAAKDFIGEDGFAEAVKKVSGALDMLNEGVFKLAENVNKMISSYSENVGNEVIVVFTIAGSPRFELYKADFGWGKPTKVEMISIAKVGGFYLSDNRDGNGGIEIGVGLKKHEAEVFKSVFVTGLESFLFHNKHSS